MNRKLVVQGLVFIVVIGVLIGAAIGLYRFATQPLATASAPVELATEVSPPTEAAEVPGSMEQMALKLYLDFRKADVDKPASDDPTLVDFSIEPGDTAQTVASRLKRLGLISDPELFRYLIRYRDLDGSLEVGDYQLAANMTMDEIIQHLLHGRSKERVVTVPEGLRMEEISELLVQTEIVDADQFLTLAREGRFDYPFLKDRPPDAPTSLEGFLFPDTYRVPLDYDAAAAIDLMLQNFDRQFTSDLRDRAAAQGMSIYEVVTYASIVEREAVIPDERPTIAAVYLNRIKQGMYLQSDPTAQYALGYQAETGQWWKIPMSLETDMKVDSPYNTYMYSGLPPGPICNSGMASIRAVLYPANTDYLFFYSRGDGSHVFAQTYEEHLANEEEYQQ